MTDKLDGKKQPTGQELATRELNAEALLANVQKRLDKAREKLADCVARLHEAEATLRTARSARKQHAKRRRRPT